MLRLLGQGCSDRGIGERTGVAGRTVNDHVPALLRGHGLQRRTRAALYAVRGSAAEPEPALVG